MVVEQMIKDNLISLTDPQQFLMQKKILKINNMPKSSEYVEFTLLSTNLSTYEKSYFINKSDKKWS